MGGKRQRTTTPHSVPSAKFFKKVALSLLSQGLQRLKTDRRFHRRFHRRFFICLKKCPKMLHFVLTNATLFLLNIWRVLNV